MSCLGCLTWACELFVWLLFWCDSQTFLRLAQYRSCMTWASPDKPDGQAVQLDQVLKLQVQKLTCESWMSMREGRSMWTKVAFGQSRLKGHLTGPRPVGVETATSKGEIEKTEVEWERKEAWQRGVTYKEGLHPVGPELACRVADGSGLGEQSCLYKSSRLSWSSQENTYQL